MPIRYENAPLHVPVRAHTVAEFFAGIGLVGIGLERAGWRVVFANDLDPQKLEIFRGHFGLEATEQLYELGDIHQLVKKPERVPTVASPA